MPNCTFHDIEIDHEKDSWGTNKIRDMICGHVITGVNIFFGGGTGAWTQDLELAR
jgi:hypothetical protein